MRFLFALMIFALAFNGYSAVSHAMPVKSAPSVNKTVHCGQLAETDNDHEHAKDDHKDTKSKCFDCTQCCTSAAILSDDIVAVQDFEDTVLNAEPSSTLAQNQFFSLLRPPRSLV